jgi:hypothetical protein
MMHGQSLVGHKKKSFAAGYGDFPYGYGSKLGTSIIKDG